MRDAYSVVEGLHHSVNTLEIAAQHNFKELDRAMARDDLAPHPDDMANLRLALMLDALVLRKLATEIDARRGEIERDATQYLQAAE